jgi:hypothetical protein
MKMSFRMALPCAALFAISACSTMSTISSPHPGTTVSIQQHELSLPARQNLKGTSFGNYEFKAVDGDAPPFYGILPLKFKGGRLAADIVLFAPAAFFNLRGAFPYYDFDVARSVIRYKLHETDTWSEYRPKPEEAARAQNYFNAKTAKERDKAG